MNVYDFDKTIFNGDSTKAFYIFCLKHNISLLRYLPKQAIGFLLYYLHIIDKTKLKECFFSFLQGVHDVDARIFAFWDINEAKIFQWYIDQKKDTDVIISASPEFLLKPIIQRLGLNNLIAARVSKQTGIYEGANCYGLEKVQRFKLKFNDSTIDNFYSDSLSDFPMAKLSKKSYLVKKQKIHCWTHSE